MTIEDRVQSLVNSLDQGVGMASMRLFFFLLFAVSVCGLYAWRQFNGLRDPEAMECAQLARNVSRGESFTTQCLRPADLRSAPRTPKPQYADLRHAPLYPAALAGGFRALHLFTGAQKPNSVMRAESRVIVPFGILVTVATGWLIFLCGRRLFGPYVGLFAMVMFFLNDAILASAISGTPGPLAALFSMGAVYAAVVASENLAENRSTGLRVLPFFVLSAALAGSAFLTTYTLGTLVIALAIYVALATPQWRWTRAILFIAISLLIAAPWLWRNVALSGSPLGTAPQAALNGTYLFPGHTFERMSAPDVNNYKVALALRLKLRAGLEHIAAEPVQSLGAGLIACFFLVSFFGRFNRPEADRFRWPLALWIALLLGCAAMASGPAASITAPAVPLVILFGTAYLLAVLENTEFLDDSLRAVGLWTAIAIAALPALLGIAGPRAAPPYPPYYPPYIEEVSRILAPSEALCTDIPWATAWYGNRTSLLLPRTLPELLSIHTNRMRIGGIYLTTETGDQPYAGALLDGAERDWLPLLNGEVPPDFPFRYGATLPPGRRDQVFLTDRSGRVQITPSAPPAAPASAPAGSR